MEIVFFLAVGFILLWKGGDLLVDGADAFARSHGVPPTIAGVFILGFGTSMPELAVTLLSALDGEAEIAVTNVVGYVGDAPTIGADAHGQQLRQQEQSAEGNQGAAHRRRRA